MLRLVPVLPVDGVDQVLEAPGQLPDSRNGEYEAAVEANERGCRFEACERGRIDSAKVAGTRDSLATQNLPHGLGEGFVTPPRYHWTSVPASWLYRALPSGVADARLNETFKHAIRWNRPHSH